MSDKPWWRPDHQEHSDTLDSLLEAEQEPEQIPIDREDTEIIDLRMALAQVRNALVADSVQRLKRALVRGSCW